MNQVKTVYCATPAGFLEVQVQDQAITQTRFVEEHEIDRTQCRVLEELLELKLAPAGTPFQKRVWQAAVTIPAGKTVSYQQLAHAIGAPTAFRAVANALGQNKIAYFIPCHRILRKNGELGGFRWGIERKALLIKSEEI